MGMEETKTMNDEGNTKYSLYVKDAVIETMDYYDHMKNSIWG